MIQFDVATENPSVEVPVIQCASAPVTEGPREIETRLVIRVMAVASISYLLPQRDDWPRAKTLR